MLRRSRGPVYDARVPSRLRIVPAAPVPAKERVRQRIKAMDKPAAMLECRCGSRELIEVRTGVLLQAGKTKGGTRQLLCAACLVKGDRVIVA